MVSEGELQQFVRTLIDAEAASDYALASRIPSTRTWKTLDYIKTLEASERNSLFDAFAANGVFYLRPDRDPRLHAHKAGHPGYQRFVDGMLRLSGPKYMGVRMMAGPATTKAPAIRRAVKEALAERFNAKAENSGGGDWKYFGESRGRHFEIHIDFGGMTDQLRYEVFFEDPDTAIRAVRLNYESLTGLGFGRWDSLTAANLQESVTLLGDLVEKLVMIPGKFRPISG